jgi:hypothetical protein
MKHFLAVFMGSVASESRTKWDAMDAASRKEREAAGMQAWGNWMSQHQSIVVTMGGPLGKTKRVSSQGVADIKNEMTGYVVVKAQSHEAAAALFLNHPHFSIFPGEAIEIMEQLPIPGQ